jgi:hypothetical protein
VPPVERSSTGVGKRPIIVERRMGRPGALPRGRQLAEFVQADDFR